MAETRTNKTYASIQLRTIPKVRTLPPNLRPNQSTTYYPKRKGAHIEERRVARLPLPE